MTRRILCSLLVWCAGCAHAPAPRAPVVHAAPAAAAPTPVIPELEFPALGLRVRMPGHVTMTESDHEVTDGTMHVEGVVSATPSQNYLVGRYFRGGRDRVKDDQLLQGAKSALKTVSREAPLALGEWRGLELEGTTADGHPAWSRTYAVGDGFWFVHAQGTGSSLDRAEARAFFDSVVITQPWSVHAFPEAHLSVLLPDGAIVVSKKALNLDEFATAQGSLVGGSEQRGYIVLAHPLSAPGSLTADERLDLAAAALERDQKRIVWQAPIVVDGARGRDFLIQTKDGWIRTRFIVTDTYLYGLQASTVSKEALLDEAVPRFLASLRWY